jgi:hypothetical protein
MCTYDTYTTIQVASMVCFVCFPAGLVPQDEGADAAEAVSRSGPAWRLRSVSGLLARSVADLALGLDALVGEHEQAPL